MKKFYTFGINFEFYVKSEEKVYKIEDRFRELERNKYDGIDEFSFIHGDRPYYKENLYWAKLFVRPTRMPKVENNRDYIPLMTELEYTASEIMRIITDGIETLDR